MDKLTGKAEEMLAGWDLDAKYKYLCFYHKGFPFMKDSWGLDYSDSKQELLDAEWGLFCSQDVADYFDNCEEFQLVLNAMATDPQFLICSDGEYVLSFAQKHQEIMGMGDAQLEEFVRQVEESLELTPREMKVMEVVDEN